MPVAPELRAAHAVAHVYANDYDAEWARLIAEPAGVVRDLWGGNVSVRRSDGLAVPQVGDLGDLRNREDQEWGLRGARAGMTGAVAPHAVAVHWHEGHVAGLLDAAADQARTGRAPRGAIPRARPGSGPRVGAPTCRRGRSWT